VLLGVVLADVVCVEVCELVAVLVPVVVPVDDAVPMHASQVAGHLVATDDTLQKAIDSEQSSGSARPLQT
jgi:hypothetical protein